MGPCHVPTPSAIIIAMCIYVLMEEEESGGVEGNV